MKELLLHENAKNYATDEQLQRDKATALVNYAAGIFDALDAFEDELFDRDYQTLMHEAASIVKFQAVEMCGTDDFKTVGEFLELASNVTYSQQLDHDAVNVIECAISINDYERAVHFFPNAVTTLDEYLNGVPLVASKHKMTLEELNAAEEDDA